MSSPPPAAPALGPPPLHLLAPFERRAFHVIEGIYRRARPLTEEYHRLISERWMNWGSARLVVPYGVDRIRHLQPSQSILLVANHRSFFDLYMLGLAMRRCLGRRFPMVCPVRADFFYERPAGVAVNLAIGGGRMFPPIFRDPAKHEFNRWALDWLAAQLRQGGVTVGFHPEGTRNKNPSPYTPLPAHPGVGKLVMDSWPIVVPAFINGMTSDILADIKSNHTLDRFAVAVFGAPVDLTPFRSMSNRLAAHKRVADHLLATIYRLGDEERAIRKEHGIP